MLKKKKKKKKRGGGQHLKKEEKKGGIIGSCPPHVPVIKITILEISKRIASKHISSLLL